MTTSAVIPQITFQGSSGSGTLGPFSLIKSGTPIYFTANSQIKVYRYDTTTDTAPTLLVEGTDYDLTGGPSAGSIMLTSPQTGLLTAERLFVYREQAITQSLDLGFAGNFSSGNIEARLDRTYEIISELRREVQSAVRFSLFDADNIPNTLPLGAVIDKLFYISGTTSAPTLATIDSPANLLANIQLTADNITNINLVGSDLGGADTIGIVAADLDGDNNIGAVAGIAALLSANIANINLVGAALDDGTISDLLDGQVGKVDTLAALQAYASPVSGQVMLMAGRASIGDGGAGYFRWITGNQSASVAADEVTSAQGNGGIWIAPATDKTGASGAWKRIYSERISVLWYGALGDGSTEDTSGIRIAGAAAIASGETLVFPRTSNGTYITEPLTFASAIRIRLDDGVTLKLKSGATEVSGELTVVKFTASNSSLKGGTIDANKAGQDKSAYNTAGGIIGNKRYYGVHVLGTSGAHLSGVEIQTNIINAADYAMYARYSDDMDVDVTCSACGAGGIIQDSDEPFIRRFIARNLNDEGWKVYPHGFDLFDVNGPRGGNILIIDQYGEGTADAGTSWSNWISGITFIRVKEPVISNLYYSQQDDRPAGEYLTDSDCTKSLAYSFQDIQGGSITNLSAQRFSSCGLELGAIDGCSISVGTFDSEYMGSSLYASETCDGTHILATSSTDGFASGAVQVPRNFTLSDISFLRCTGPGVALFAGENITLDNIRSNGNRDGIYRVPFAQSVSFPSGSPGLRNITVNGGEFCYNERYGIQDNGGIDFQVIGAKISNNGQSRTHATAGTLRGTGTFAGPSAGYNGADGSPAVARTRTRLIDCHVQDDQSTTAIYGSAVSTDPRVVWVTEAEHYHIGQTVTLKGCGPASADLVTQILDIDQDALTVADALSTFPTVSGTGTISTSGTTLTGAGTAFLTELDGPTYITAGGETRLVIAGTTDTAGLLQEAFTSDLSGESFTIITFQAQQIRCQGYGIRTASATNDATLICDGIDFGVGNLTGNTSLASISALREMGKIPKQAIWVGPAEWQLNAGSTSVGQDGGSRLSNWRLDGGTTEGLSATIYCPVAATYRPYIVWHNAGAGAGDVWFVWNYAAHEAGESWNDAGTTVNLYPAAGSQDVQIRTDTGADLSVAAGDLLRLRILRGGGDASDTLANDVGIQGVLLVPVVS